MSDVKKLQRGVSKCVKCDRRISLSTGAWNDIKAWRDPDDASVRCKAGGKHEPRREHVEA